MKINTPPLTIWRNPTHFIACGFGLGAFPYAPGTIGTLGAIPLTILLSRLTTPTYIVACVLLFIIGTIICGQTNKDFGTDDHSAAVFDELGTFPIALFLVPLSATSVIAAFVLFRFFDIAKPGPIGWIDRHVHGGIGVMLDDALAALVTCLIIHFALWILN